MSWNPFKAFTGRRTRSEDVEFDREVNKLKQMQAVSKRMYKDMKKCNEIETGYLRCKQQLVNDVKSSPLARSEPLRFMAEVLGVMIQSHHVHSRELKTSQDSVFVDPMKRLNNVYKQVELQARQREQKLQELEKQQQKHGRKSAAGSLQYQQQHTGSQSKLESSQRTVTTARTDYERVHDRLMLEIPQLLDGRVNYFGVCLLAVIKAQNLYYSECSSNILSSLRSLLETEDELQSSSAAAGVKSEDEIHQATATHLADIKTLSIVGNPQPHS